MSDVSTRGLVKVQERAVRARKELQHHQANEIPTKNWVTRDNTGRCYTYRGVKYCYR